MNLAPVTIFGLLTAALIYGKKLTLLSAAACTVFGLFAASTHAGQAVMQEILSAMS